MGNDANCRENVCCKERDGPVSSGAAETYGNTNCDTPYSSLSAILDSIKKTYTPDIVVITGGVYGRDLRTNSTWIISNISMNSNL